MLNEKISILYVDNERVNLLAFKANFRNEYHVFTAESVVKGMQVLDKQEVQIVIADQQISEMTGVQFLETICDTSPNSICILLTGFSDVSAVIDSINKGKIYNYVTKPWNEEELRRTIAEAKETYALRIRNNEFAEKYEQLYRLVPYPVILLNAKARVTGVNKAAKALFGCNCENLHPQQHVPFFSEEITLENILRKIKATGGLTGFSVLVNTTDGRTISYALNASPAKLNAYYGSNYQLIFIPQDKG